MAALVEAPEPTEQRPDVQPDDQQPVSNQQPGGLNLNETQFQRLVDRACDRINELRMEQGIDSSGMAVENGWAWQREKNQMQSDNSWEWRRALGGIFKYCVAPETLVLTTDLIWKRADEVALGEELLGFDEHAPDDIRTSQRRHRNSGVLHDYTRNIGQRKFRRAAVLNADRLTEPCLEIVTDDGKIRCSTKHRMLVLRDGYRHPYVWVQASDIRVGDCLVWVAPTWMEDTSKLAGYIAGVFDGEGCCKVDISFAQKKNELFATTIDALAKKGFETKTFPDYNEHGCLTTHIIGGLAEKLRFIGSIRPPRLLQKSCRLWEGRECCSKGSRRSVITKIKVCGEQEVIALQTTTGTFIANGFLSHNSNFSLNISKRFARLMAARATDTLVGTDPFFAAMPTEHGSPDLARQGEYYVQEQITEVNAKKQIKEAEKLALIRNEAVVKLAWLNTQTHFRGPITVAVGPNEYEYQGEVHRFGAGEAIPTPKGDWIYPDDNFFDDQEVEGMFRLEKEPAVAFRLQIEYKWFPDLDQSLERRSGLDLRTLHYCDFLCPLKVSSVHEADINVHLYDEQFENLQMTYRGLPMADKYFAENVPPTNAGKQSGDQQPKTEKGEMEDASQHLRVVHVAEVYMRCNPYAEGEEGDLGMESELMLVIDVTAKKLIWADYLGNHMKKRPFEVIPGVECVSGRWYGVGVFEMLDHKQLYIDTQFNRVNFKSSKSSSVRFRMRNAVSQWKNGEKLVVGDDKILDIEDPRYDAKNPPLFQVNLTEIDENAMKLIELMIQAGSTEVGIAGPDDAGMAGLDSQKLATGIKSLERTGNMLMKFTESDHADAITEILDQAVDIILEHMDENEMMYKADTNELIKLNRQEIRRMKKSVTLLLTKSRSTETIETARMVIQLVREYYEALNPFEQQKLRPEYLRQLKALETPDADQLLVLVSDDDVTKWKQQQAEAATMVPKASIATKYPDLERSEQEQVLKREGIEPAQVGPLRAGQRQDINQTTLEAQAKEKAKNLAPKPAPAAAPKKK